MGYEGRKVDRRRKRERWAKVVGSTGNRMVYAHEVGVEWDKTW
jgi:hypothetical protein